MKILFDQNISRGLREHLPGHAVFTSREMGWSELADNKLMDAAEADGFEVLITADQRIPKQQNLAGRKIRLVILNTNRWLPISRKTHEIETALMTTSPQGFVLDTVIPPVRRGQRP